MTANGLRICDVADLAAVSFILAQMFIRSRMFHLPLNPPYPQMSCYGLVYFFFLLKGLVLSLGTSDVVGTIKYLFLSLVIIYNVLFNIINAWLSFLTSVGDSALM